MQTAAQATAKYWYLRSGAGPYLAPYLTEEILSFVLLQQRVHRLQQIQYLQDGPPA